jgi:drug/metabolite transporter (DMT)-like permease
MKSKLPYLGLLLTGVIWGSNFGIARNAMKMFDPVLFTFLRFALAVPLFFLILKISEGSIKVAPRDALKLAALGFMGVTCLEIAVSYSINLTTLANASLLNVAPWPIFAALFAPFVTKERITSRLIVGGVLAMAGVCLIIAGGGEGFDMSSSHMAGNMLAFGVSILGALFNVFCMPLMSRYSPLRVSTWYVMFGTLFMLPFTWGTWGTVNWSGVGVGNWLAIAYNVVFAAIAAFLMWNASMLRIGAARANFFRYMVPVAAMLEGYFMFAESVALWQMIGGLLVLGGLVWIVMDKKTTAITQDIAA